MTTMYTPGEVRKIKAERDALLEAAANASAHLKTLIKPSKHTGIVCEGCLEDIFQATQWLDEAAEEAEGRG